MRTIGIIGGLGPEATADYYKEIIQKFNEINPSTNLNYPEMVIYSVNMSKFIGYLQDKRYEDAANYISTCINRLQSAGADFAAISANTPHLLFNEIQQKCRLPLLSIVDAVREKAQNLNLKRLALLGTKFTMSNPFYADAFLAYGMQVVVPSAAIIEVINEKLFTELELGIYKAETQALLLDIVAEMMRDQGVDSVILGCTEFPIMFTKDEYLGIPFLNTTRIHVNKIVDACINY